MKIDRRIKYRLVIDTETAPIDRTIEEVLPSNMLVYDIGWAVVDKRGKVYLSRSFVNQDVFLGEPVAMKSAYYFEKIPRYWEDIHDGTRILTDWDTIKKAVRDDIALFNINEIYAHNARFDIGTLNATERHITNGKRKYFFPYGMTICDTMKMSRAVLGKMPTYRKFCQRNGYVTSRGQNRYTAEVIYRYITKNLDFIEAHKGLDDVMIEKEIMSYCFRQHKKMDRILYRGA